MASRRSSLFQLLRQQLQSFSGPKNVELPVSAYGKLPIYKDFLRHGLAGSEAQAFKKWLDRGIALHCTNDANYRDRPILPHALLLGFPATGKQVLSFLWDSHDHGGLRRFPFVLFVSLPATRSSSPLPLLHALGQVAAQGTVLQQTIRGLSDVAAFYPLIRTATIRLTLESDEKVRERWDRAVRELSVEDLGASFYGENSDRLWAALLAYLERQRLDARSLPALRLPASGALPTSYLAVLWSLLLESDKRSKTPLQMFFAPGEPEAGVTLLRRDLRSDDIFGLFLEAPGYEYILDLRHEVPGSGSVRPLSGEQGRRPVGDLVSPHFLTESKG